MKNSIQIWYLMMRHQEFLTPLSAKLFYHNQRLHQIMRWGYPVQYFLQIT